MMSNRARGVSSSVTSTGETGIEASEIKCNVLALCNAKHTPPRRTRQFSPSAAVGV
jgi:hypothetical protein